MGRFWLGICLLVGLLVFGLWMMQDMSATHLQIADMLEQAVEKAIQGQTQSAEELMAAAKSKWDKRWHMTAAVADHGPMDELDGLFARIETSLRSGSTPEFASECARAAQLVKAMGGAHRLNWWNLL